MHKFFFITFFLQTSFISAAPQSLTDLALQRLISLGKKRRVSE